MWCDAHPRSVSLVSFLGLGLLHFTPSRVPSAVIIPDSDIICRFLLKSIYLGTRLTLSNQSCLDDFLEATVCRALYLNLLDLLPDLLCLLGSMLEMFPLDGDLAFCGGRLLYGRLLGDGDLLYDLQSWNRYSLSVEINSPSLYHPKKSDPSSGSAITFINSPFTTVASPDTNPFPSDLRYTLFCSI